MSPEEFLNANLVDGELNPLMHYVIQGYHSNMHQLSKITIPYMHLAHQPVPLSQVTLR